MLGKILQGVWVTFKVILSLAMVGLLIALGVALVSANASGIGWGGVIITAAFLIAAFLGLWNIGPAQAVWEVIIKLGATAILLMVAWAMITLVGGGTLRGWYFAALAATGCVFMALGLWPVGRLVSNRRWSGLLIALTVAWIFLLLPVMIETFPHECGGSLNGIWYCQSMNLLYEIGGHWAVFGAHFVVAGYFIYFGMRQFFRGSVRGSARPAEISVS